MTHPILCCHGWWSYIRKLLIVQQRKRDTITDKVGHEYQLKMHSVVSKGVGDASSSVWITTSPTFPMLWLHVCFYTTCVKCLEIIALMSGYTTRPQQQHKPAVSLPASVELVPLSFVMPSRTLLVAVHTVLDTENLPFSTDTPRRFTEGSHAAIRRRSCSNACIVSAGMRGRFEDLYNVESADERESIRTWSNTSNGCWSSILAVMLPLRGSLHWSAIRKTTAYIASVQLSWMVVINKRSICYKQVQYLFKHSKVMHK